MKIISFIEDEPVESLSLDLEALDRKVEREKKARPPPKIRTAPTRTDTLIDDSFSQLKELLINNMYGSLLFRKLA